MSRFVEGLEYFLCFVHWFS